MLIFIGDIVLLHFSIYSDSTRCAYTHYTRNKAWRQVIMPPVQSALYSIYYYYYYLYVLGILLLSLISCICMSLPDTILANQRSRELMRSHYRSTTTTKQDNPDMSNYI